MSERPFISSALGDRPTVPYPNAGTVASKLFQFTDEDKKYSPVLIIAQNT